MLTTDSTGGAKGPAGRRVAPRWLGMALCCGLAAFVATEAAAQPACLRADERAALEVRAFQTDLMVAALSCNFQSTYNKFMVRFGPEIDHHTRTMHRFFNRTYGAGGTNQATRYFTRFANRSALTSVANIDKFCDESAATLQAVLVVAPKAIATFAGKQRTAMRVDSDFAACTLANN